MFPETITHKIFATNCNFQVRYDTMGKAFFLFFKVFCYDQQNFYFDKKIEQ